MRMLGEQGQLKLLVNLTWNKVSFVEFQTWIAWMWKHRRCWLKGLTQGGIMFAFLLGQTQSPFENKLLVAWFFFVKQAPPAKFGRLLRTNAMEYRNITLIPLSHRSRDHVCQFSWDLEKICGKSSKKCVLKKIQNGGKSILTQMGVVYLGRCATTQGIQGKNNFDFPTYGSRVIGQNVKWAVIAPPWGRLKNV